MRPKGREQVDEASKILGFAAEGGHPAYKSLDAPSIFVFDKIF